MPTPHVTVNSHTVQLSALHDVSDMSSIRAKALEIALDRLRAAFDAAPATPSKVGALRKQLEDQERKTATAARDIRIADAELARLAIDPDSNDHLAVLAAARATKAAAVERHREAVAGVELLGRLAYNERESAGRMLSVAVGSWRTPVRETFEQQRRALQASLEKEIAEAFVKFAPKIQEMLLCVNVVEIVSGASEVILDLHTELAEKRLGTPLPRPTPDPTELAMPDATAAPSPMLPALEPSGSTSVVYRY